MRPKEITVTLSEQEKTLFWSKVDIKEDKTECWEWNAAFIKGRMYGKVGIRRRFYLAHRMSYYIHFGNPGTLLVCHHCDNPKCCNPHHLFLGTDKDNSEDMVKKKRVVRGERHWSKKNPELLPLGDKHYSRRQPDLVLRGESNGNSKLSENQVIEIRNKYKQGSTQEELAELNGVSRSLIGGIVNNRKWKHLLPKEIITPKISYAFGYINA